MNRISYVMSFLSFKILALSILVTAVEPLWAQSTRPTVLVIGVVDSANPRSFYSELQQTFHKAFPQHEYIQVISAKEGTDKERHVEGYKDILQQLKKVDFSGRLITHVVFSTHGQTYNIGSNNEYTTLLSLGTFSKQGPAEDLAELVNVFRNNVSSSATVVLEACRTMAGESQLAWLRGTELLKYMGAKDGTLFGAIGYTPAISERLYDKTYIRAKQSAKIATVVAVAILASLHFNNSPLNIESLILTASMAGASTIAIEILTYFRDWIQASWVKGWFIHLRSGRIHMTKRLSPLKARNEIYGLEHPAISCRRIFQ